MNALSPIDGLTIAAYLAAILYVGARMARRQRSTAEFFIANRRLPGWAVAFSIVGTVISSVSFVAFPGAAFMENWRLLLPNLMVPAVFALVTLKIVPFYRRVVGMSSYEYLEKRFGPWARLYGSAGFMVLRVFDLGFTLLLTSIAAEVIAGWDIRMVIVGIGAFTLLYTLLGGIEAVVWNDVVQGLVLATGALAILALVLFRPEAGPGAVISAAASAGKFGMGDFGFTWQSLFSDRPTAWLLMLSGLFHFGRAYAVEQNMVQRYLVARSDREAQKATATGAVSCLVIWILFTFIGSAMWGFYQVTQAAVPPEVLAKPDNILPYFIATQFPKGLLGLVLAAVLAAAMQAFSADLTSVGTVATQDYYARFVPGSSDRSRLQFGRGAVLVGGALAVTVALLLTNARTRSLYEVFISLSMVLAGGMLGLFLLGFLSRRATGAGANVGIVCCMSFVAWATLTGPLEVDLGVNFRMHPILIGVLSHPLLFVSGYVASRPWRRERHAADGLTVWGLRQVEPVRDCVEETATGS